MSARKTLVFGGSGFLGRYIVDALKADGHRVTVVSRNPGAAHALLPKGVKTVAGDLRSIDWDALVALIRGHSALVYAAGADERVKPDGDPLAYYRRENVDTAQRVFEAAAEAGIERAVLLNSIFSTLDRLRPELELPRHHSYIRSRVEQRDMALAVARGHFVATVLEIPWVFGDSRGSDSQWASLIEMLRVTPALFAPRGGTVVVSARNVGAAAAGALRYPKRSSAVPVGDRWMSWDELFSTLARCCGRPPMSVARVPDKLLTQFNQLSGLGQRLFRLRSGLDYGRMQDFLLDETPVNLRNSRQRLGYAPGDLDSAFAETVASVPESRATRALRSILAGAGG